MKILHSPVPMFFPPSFSDFGDSFCAFTTGKSFNYNSQYLSCGPCSGGVFEGRKQPSQTCCRTLFASRLPVDQRYLLLHIMFVSVDSIFPILKVLLWCAAPENVQAAQKYITGLDARRISKLPEQRYYNSPLPMPWKPTGVYSP